MAAGFGGANGEVSASAARHVGFRLGGIFVLVGGWFVVLAVGRLGRDGQAGERGVGLVGVHRRHGIGPFVECHLRDCIGLIRQPQVTNARDA